MSIVYLKIKIKSLAAESRIIRQEVKKHKFGGTKQLITKEITTKAQGDILENAPESNAEYIARRKKLFNNLVQVYGEEKAQKYLERSRRTVVGLQEHRQNTVRFAARHAQLAYAYLRNIPYKRVELKHREGNLPNLSCIQSNVFKFGDIKDMEYVRIHVAKWLKGEESSKKVA